MKVFETKVTMDNVKINLIKPMTNSPFTIKEDEDMQKLRESISQFGLLSPIVIRELPDTNEYEIVCGNRRLQILNELGYDTAPVLINNLYDDEASFEKKKMIVSCLIKRVEVSRGYKLQIEFNIDFEQFMVGIDKVA